MTKQNTRPRPTLLPRSSVLITECPAEFAAFRQKVLDELRPAGAICDFLVEDLVRILWDIKRYRRTKTALINSQYREALRTLYSQLTRPPANDCLAYEQDEGDEQEDDRPTEQESTAEQDESGRTTDPLLNRLIDLGEDEFADQWFTRWEVRADFEQLLNRYKLDETAIEGEAIRRLHFVLEQFENMLRSLERRFERTLRLLDERRFANGSGGGLEDNGSRGSKQDKVTAISPQKRRGRAA